MPYIALQLVGIQAVLTVMGVGTSSTNTYVKDLPLFIAFLVLAIYTYVSGLRAPALIAFVKDVLVYVMVIVAVFYIPTRIGGWGHIFAAGQAHLKAISPVTHKPNGMFIPTTGNSQLAFSTLALGSALALMVYPHSITGVLSTKRRDIIKRNMALLPIYSVLLAFVALLGYMAVADKATVANVKKAGGNAQLAVPYLFQHMFPSWFTGVAFSAIVIGALVPAAIMAIASACSPAGSTAGRCWRAGWPAWCSAPSPPTRWPPPPPPTGPGRWTSNSVTRSTSAWPPSSETSRSRSS